MSEVTKQLQREWILEERTVSVRAGKGGYEYFSFHLDVKSEHHVFFDISVLQPPGRSNLDIRFFVVDNDNFQKWLKGAPHTAFVIAPRFLHGELSFSPPTSGLYYAILDNQYSALTSKQIEFSIHETWLEEAPRKIEEPPKIEPKPEVGLLRRIYNRLRYSRSLGFIGLLIVVQIFCFLLAILVAFLFHFTLGLEYKDVMSYIATAVGASAVVMLIYLYYVHTGRILTLPSPA